MPIESMDNGRSNPGTEIGNNKRIEKCKGEVWNVSKSLQIKQGKDQNMRIKYQTPHTTSSTAERFQEQETRKPNLEEFTTKN